MSGVPSGRPSAQAVAQARYAELLAENPGISKREAAKLIRASMGPHAPKVESIIRYLADSGIEIQTTSAPAPPIPADELWEAAKIASAKAIARAATRGRATLRVDTAKPFGILHSSDEHLDSRSCDLAELERTADTVRATEGLYAGLHGDLRDNFVIRALMRAQMKSHHEPEEQFRLVDHYLSLFGPRKVLYLVAGNHDQWEPGLTGIDTLKSLAGEHRILYDSDQFFIKLEVGGGPTYRLLIRHQWKMNSSYNPTHTCMQATRMGVADEPPDVVIMGHHHEPAATYWYWYGKQRIAIKTGSAKRHDDYAHKKGFPDGGFMAPVVIFWPDRPKALVFPDYRDGADYLNFLRGRA